MLGRFFSRMSRRGRIAVFIQLFLWPIVIAYSAGGLGIRLNVTPSVPPGLYRVTADSNAPFVEFCPPGEFGSLSVERGYRPRGSGCPDHGERLLKPVIAVSGDVVQVSPKGISVNGETIPNSTAQERDSYGRTLKAWPFGVYPVETGTIWVVSQYETRSFDSHYFGPIQLREVKNRLRPLWTTP